MVEHIEDTRQSTRERRAGSVNAPRQAMPLSEIDLTEEPRVPVPIEEFSRVLGGGLVPGSLVLLGGETRHRQVDTGA